MAKLDDLVPPGLLNGVATRADRVVLDMDSSESPVHGAQEGSAYNGHFESVCYHPLFLFTEHGDCLAATLRPGNVHSAEDWDDLLLPEIDRQRAAGKRVAFRADAAFAKPEIYDALEKRDVDYVIRMPANKSLELEIEAILFRPPGRPSCKPLVRYKSFRYQAKSWTTPRRIKRWSLTSLQQRLVKTGGRLVKHARYYWLLLAEGHLTRRLFGDMLRRIWALPVPAG